tara:strand:+ start:143 stop:292 length:150 start_codon:yes stop_codon:yes gene_type:complete
MSDKKLVYIDWEALKLKPITPEQKKRQTLSALGKRRSTKIKKRLTRHEK